MEFKNDIILNGVTYFNGTLHDYKTNETKQYNPNSKIYYSIIENKENKKGYFETFLKAPPEYFQKLKDVQFPAKAQIIFRINNNQKMEFVDIKVL